MRLSLSILFLLSFLSVSAKDYHVSVKGSDENKGSVSRPFRTISKAASVALPGDRVIVHAGTYREMVQPPRSGTSDRNRIIYMAAPGEVVTIKGSEIVKGWQPVKEDLWKITLPYRFFGLYNPFTDKVWGDWYGGWIHTGQVYLNEKPLSEVDSLYKILQGKPAAARQGAEMRPFMDSTYTWFTRSDSGKTTLYARFGSYDPNRESVEINVRPACFYPKENHINYITVKGFHLSMAATQWAAPTAEQPGLIGTNWSKGWIIEDNVISNSTCSGVTLGKDRASGDNMWSKDPSIDGSVHYNDLVHRVIANGWNKATIGSHIVRNNIIFNCGQAGICGSFGGAYSTIYGNEIFNIYTYRVYGGAEMAGIKLHAAIDVQIHDNYVHHANLGLWLDWMAQGTRVSRNLFANNDNVDLFVEVSHGPYLVDNNIFLSTNSIQDWSEGGAFAHNLIGGTVATWSQGRQTPIFEPHTTHWLGIKLIAGGDDRFYNNIFTGDPSTAQPAWAFFQPKTIAQHEGLDVYDKTIYPVVANGNVYTNAAQPGTMETDMVIQKGDPPAVQIDEGRVGFAWQVPERGGSWVTTARLGTTRVSHASFENPDGSPLRVDLDYFGNQRDQPLAGPFGAAGAVHLTLWPKK